MTKRRIKKNVYIVGGKANLDAQKDSILDRIDSQIEKAQASLLDLGVQVAALRGDPDSEKATANLEFFSPPKIAGDRELFKGSNGK